MKESSDISMHKFLETEIKVLNFSLCPTIGPNSPKYNQNWKTGFTGTQESWYKMINDSFMKLKQISHFW